MQLLIAALLLFAVVYFWRGRQPAETRDGAKNGGAQGATAGGKPRTRSVPWWVLVLFCVALLVTMRTGFHWIAVAVGAVAAVLNRVLPMLRYAPLFQQGFRHFRAQQRATPADPGAAGNARASRSGMSRAEALQVLGLTEAATREEISATYKELIRRVHPDRGGSEFLAKQLNQAKDVLLT